MNTSSEIWRVCGWKAIQDKNGKKKPLFLKRAIDTKIRRHIKIIAKANPFDPLYKDYS